MRQSRHTLILLLQTRVGPNRWIALFEIALFYIALFEVALFEIVHPSLASITHRRSDHYKGGDFLWKSCCLILSFDRYIHVHRYIQALLTSLHISSRCLLSPLLRMTSTSELPNPSDEMHELTVRPVRGHWEIIDGRESVLTEEQQPPKKEKRGLLRKMKSFQVKDSMKGSRDRGVVPSQKDSFLAFLCGIKTATFRTGIHVTAGEPDFSSSTAGAKSLPRDRKSSTTTLSESMPEYLKPLNTHVDGIVANPTSNLGSAELQALWSLVGKAMDEFDPFSGWDSPLPESDAELLNASPHVVRSYLKTNASEENWLNVELTKSILQITNIVLRKASRAVQKCFREGTDEQKEKYGPLIKLLDVEAHPGNLLVITDTGSGVPGQAGLRAVPDFTVWLRDDDSGTSSTLLPHPHLSP